MRVGVVRQRRLARARVLGWGVCRKWVRRGCFQRTRGWRIARSLDCFKVSGRQMQSPGLIGEGEVAGLPSRAVQRRSRC